MNNKSIVYLRDLREELEHTPASHWSNIKIWAAKTMPLIKSNWPNYYEEFNEATKEPQMGAIVAAGGRGQFWSNEPAVFAGHKVDCERQKKKLMGLIDGIIGISSIDTDFADVSPPNRITGLCKRFPIFARQLRNRERNRPSLEIQDEYDVQYLMNALLRLHFDDVRPEEWAPSYAGANSRVDFLLKNERIVIEVKKTRTNLKDKDVGEQLIIDIERYARHPECDTLICFVYDPDNFISNPRGLENDLSGKRETITVKVIVSPE